MTRKEKQMIDTLFDMAVDIPDPAFGVRLSACILSKNRVLSYGFNSDKTHTFCAKFSRHVDAIFWHAETNAIHNAIKRYGEESIEGSTLIVVRAKKESPRGKLIPGLALPCKGCTAAIKYYGIKKVIYTHDEDTIGKLFFE